MNRQTVRRMVVKGIMAYTAVFSIVMLVAMPAIALVAANQVNSASIINGQVKTKDIKKRAITGKKIAKNAVRSMQIKNGQVTSADIRNRTIKDIDIKRTTETKYLSVPPIAFRPDDEGTQYSSSSLQLSVDDYSGDRLDFSAPVNLPDGARVISVRSKCMNEAASQKIWAFLRRVGFYGGDSLMANITPTPGQLGWQYPVDTTITDPVINNKENSYSAEFSFYSMDVQAGGMIIEYEIQAP